MAICKPLYTAILDGIQKRFGEDLANEEFVLSAVLHPKFKFSWKPQAEQAKAEDLLRTELNKMISTTDAEGNEDLNQSTCSGEDFDGFFPKAKSDNQMEPNDLINLYKGRNTRKLEHLYSIPFFKSLFVKYNTPIPSSAPVERLFSQGGGVFRKNRFRLLDSSYEKQLMLKVNASLLG